MVLIQVQRLSIRLFLAVIVSFMQPSHHLLTLLSVGRTYYIRMNSSTVCEHLAAEFSTLAADARLRADRKSKFRRSQELVCRVFDSTAFQLSAASLIFLVCVPQQRRAAASLLIQTRLPPSPLPLPCYTQSILSPSLPPASPRLS